MKGVVKGIVVFFFAALVVCWTPPTGAAPKPAPAPAPGYVDGSRFLDLAGDDASTVEVNLKGALLRALVAFDPELKKIAGGLESIHAVVIENADPARAAKVRTLMRETERRLLDDKWERLATVKDDEANLSVLVLSDDEVIRGLVVLVADLEEGELVFANIAGVIDLVAIAALGETLDIPGLDRLGDD